MIQSNYRAHTLHKDIRKGVSEKEVFRLKPEIYRKPMKYIGSQWKPKRIVGIASAKVLRQEKAQCIQDKKEVSPAGVECGRECGKRWLLAKSAESRSCSTLKEKVKNCGFSSKTMRKSFTDFNGGGGDEIISFMT